MPFKIGLVERDQWLACMDQAMGEVGVDEELRGKLRESFAGTADWMRTRQADHGDEEFRNPQEFMGLFIWCRER
jgi:truncated hemoglobin YjbI